MTIARLTQPIARLLTRNEPRLLMYHRFANDGDERHSTVGQLLRHIELAKRHCDFVTVTEAVRARRSGRRLARPQVALTVDDGYRDFYELAWPALRAAGVPATIYVVVNFIEGRSWLWPDMLEYVLLKTSREDLVLDAPAISHRFELGDLASRRRAWERIADVMVRAGAERPELLDQVAAAAGVELPHAPPSNVQPMSWPQLREIAGSGCEIGSHGLEHWRMSVLSDTQVRNELEESRRIIEQNTGSRVTGFAYPNGGPDDVSDHVDRIAAQCGYDYTICAFWSARHARRDSLQLGRWTCGDDAATLNVLSGTSMLKRRLLRA